VDSTITTKGQTTVPKPVRDHLGLKPGDKVRYFIRPDGGVAMLPVLPVASLRGLGKRNGPPVTLEEMNEAIAAGAAGEPLPNGRR
jgi:antitoxin PrlF